MNSYTDIRSGIATWFERLYTNVLRLSELVGSSEERPRVNRRGTTPAETAKDRVSIGSALSQYRV